ncbi:TRAP transporter permease [Anaerotalea alkaliphila]|uniref:TRAP transporter fused permease subunit n=1 Tax=Anaerotalea alkaliphila TaxID=2662126 RepID=A0A7X5KNI8_9FIRM|nr:TRAP transporter fused permease subunit [Anaerotalea alkaliphila]NDL66797.1 TRAP transporter fused permease subunit [Anaerotalea alkaliphila]
MIKQFAKAVPEYYTKVSLVACSALFLYFAAFGSTSLIIQRSLLLTLLVPTVFITIPLTFRGKTNGWTKAVDLALAISLIAAGIYIIMVWDARIMKTGAVPATDVVMGTIMIILVLIAAQRTTGKILSIISAVFLLYAYFGPYMPGFLVHRGETWTRIVTFMYVSTEGIFGTPVGIAATYIMVFIVFGAFLEKFGAGQWFVDFAFSVTGKYRGGPAKTAVLASGLMGMISGSPAANVVTTGSFTIPLMKKTGYKDYEAAAVEAVASTGGMFAPPIMGAGAFIMAQYLGLPYATIAKAAIMPALLYYFSIMLSVDSIAIMSGIKGLKKEELPPISSVLGKRLLNAIPILVLVLLIASGLSPAKASVYCVGSILLVAFAQPEYRPTIKKVLQALYEGGSGGVAIAATCACAGLIVGVLSMTGIGAKLSYQLISITGGNIYIGAILVAIVAIILGCGMPPTAVYIILAAVLAPPLADMGATPLAAHMFVFIFSCLGAITPPVALTAYTAAAIAKADPNKTGFRAFRFGIVAYIVPFIFITSPALLLHETSSILATTVACITAVLGILSLVAALEGCLIVRINRLQRVLLLVAGFVLMMPGGYTDLVGIVIMAVAILIGAAVNKKVKVVQL